MKSFFVIAVVLVATCHCGYVSDWKAKVLDFLDGNTGEPVASVIRVTRPLTSGASLKWEGFNRQIRKNNEDPTCREAARALLINGEDQFKFKADTVGIVQCKRVKTDKPNEEKYKMHVVADWTNEKHELRQLRCKGFEATKTEKYWEFYGHSMELGGIKGKICERLYIGANGYSVESIIPGGAGNASVKRFTPGDFTAKCDSTKGICDVFRNGKLFLRFTTADKNKALDAAKKYWPSYGY